MTVTLENAVHNVIKDVQDSYPEMTFPQAIKHTLDTVSVDQLDMDGETGPSYQLVLTSPLTALLVEVAAQDEVTLDPSDVVEVDGMATIDGMDAFEWLHSMISE